MAKSKILSLTLVIAASLVSVNGRSPGFESNRLKRQNNGTANPIVRFSDGAVRGFTMRTATGRAIDGFQSIPFAQPPIGDLRFADPVKNLPWNGTRDAIAQSPQCIQLDFLKYLIIHGQEDCLYLNVYRPQGRSPTAEPLPVLVWIHGGAFFFGSGAIYGPAYMLDRDVILVTSNHRIGPFGFFSTHDDASPGNQGLKDQTMMLRWVQENIAAFGGDKNAVTIQGESSGGIAVHHHMASPLSRGLFRAVISDSAICDPKYLENPLETARRYGDFFKCRGDTYEMVNCLRRQPAVALVPVFLTIVEWAIFPVTFAPVIEHDHPGAFLTETRKEAYLNGRVANVPLIHGFNENEMGWITAVVMLNPLYVADINHRWDEIGPLILNLRDNPAEMVQRAWEIRRFYMGNETLRWETRNLFADMLSDRLLTTCGLETMRHHSRYTEAEVYAYRFIYHGRYSINQKFLQRPQDWGAVHLDELIYVYNNTDYWPTLKPTDQDFPMTRVMTSMWSNFVRERRPLLESNGTLVDVWQPIPQSTSSTSPVRFLEIDMTPTMIDDPFVERYELWRSYGLVD